MIGVSSLDVGTASAQSTLFKRPSPPAVGGTGFASVGGRTSVPYGWVDFCGRRPKECKVADLAPVNVKLTAENLRTLRRINLKANNYIVPVSNYDHWGTMLDHWDYPVDGKGDCKIYALYKRKLLMEAGFPRQALLMTIVRDLNDEGHTILTVKTDKGDLILDNLVNEVRPWDATGYYFLKRQSQQNPNVWVSINQRGGKPKTFTKIASN
ncbi:MAG: transglutaminase-like cysteine peptidase [Pseudomonadota bacterium]